MTWTWSQFDAHISQEGWESMVTHWMSSGMMIGILFIAGLYSPLHSLLQSQSSAYRQLSRDGQTVVITHVIEAIFLSLVFVPLTYLILSLNFEAQDAERFQRKGTAVATIMFVTIMMYMVELAARYQNPRPLVVFHHLCAYADSLFPGIIMTTANIRAASLLVYFISYEAIIFVGLVMYRLCPQHRLTRPVILTGMLVFGLSRPVQIVWIYGTLLTVWNDVVTWQAVVQMVLTLVFTVVQVYSLTIHYSLYKKCGPKLNNSHNNNTAHGMASDDPVMAMELQEGASKKELDRTNSDSDGEEVC